MKHLGILLLLAVLLISCSRHGSSSDSLKESSEAKALLQGIWTDQTSEAVVFKISGDSIYYPDSTSQTAYFRVLDDTLYINKSPYHIEKQSEHVLWFIGQDGELVKLQKNVTEDTEEVFQKTDPQILTLTDVLKKDTVVMYNDNRYHLYIAINPTHYKVVRHTLNDDGLDVENVYYDNIIHLSIYRGSREIFGRDFRKKMFESKLDENFLSQAVLNNMEFDHIDSEGIHVNSSLCMPGDASYYLVKHVITFDGQLK